MMNPLPGDVFSRYLCIEGRLVLQDAILQGKLFPYLVCPLRGARDGSRTRSFTGLKSDASSNCATLANIKKKGDQLGAPLIRRDVNTPTVLPPSNNRERLTLISHNTTCFPREYKEERRPSV